MNLNNPKNLPASQIAANFGIPNIGLQVQGSATANLNLNLGLDFGLKKDSGFFLDASNTDEFKLGLSSSVTSLDTSANLGLLKLNVQNHNTQFNGNFALDLQDQNSDGQIVAAEILPKLNGNANIGLKAQTTLGDSAVLPSFNFNFNLGVPDVFASNIQPQVSFTEVNVGLGSFFQNFTKPVLQNVDKVIAPIRPVLQGLTTNIAFLTDDIPSGLGLKSVLDVEQVATPGDVTILDILKFVDTVKPIPGLAQSLEFIKSARDITQLLDVASSIATSNQINLGSFEFNTENPQNATLNATSTDVINSQLASFAPNFSSSLQQFGGIQFPVLTSPQEAFNLLQQAALPDIAATNLLLKRPSNLFIYDMPALQFDFDPPDIPIPILPPLFAKIGIDNIKAKMDFAFGYDTAGIAALGGSGSVFNGFYVRWRQPRRHGRGYSGSHVCWRYCCQTQSRCRCFRPLWRWFCPK